MDNFEKAEGNEEREPNANVDHYHAHDENCGDMGHSLKKMDKGEAEMPTPMNEHTEPEEIKDRDEVGNHKGEYPGFIRKFR